MERTNIFNPAVHTSCAVHFARAVARFNKCRRAAPPRRSELSARSRRLGGSEGRASSSDCGRSAGRAAARRKKYANGGNTKVVHIYAQPFALIARVAPPAPRPPRRAYECRRRRGGVRFVPNESSSGWSSRNSARDTRTSSESEAEYFCIKSTNRTISTNRCNDGTDERRRQPSESMRERKQLIEAASAGACPEALNGVPNCGARPPRARETPLAIIPDSYKTNGMALCYAVIPALCRRSRLSGVHAAVYYIPFTASLYHIVNHYPDPRLALDPDHLSPVLDFVLGVDLDLDHIISGEEESARTERCKLSLSSAPLVTPSLLGPFVTSEFASKTESDTTNSRPVLLKSDSFRGRPAAARAEVSSPLAAAGAAPRRALVAVTLRRPRDTALSEFVCRPPPANKHRSPLGAAPAPARAGAPRRRRAPDRDARHGRPLDDRIVKNSQMKDYVYRVKVPLAESGTHKIPSL
ncbi:hypothetical protein EVAR_24180_1 [Eumeta japonica]|uniref:Uncharacterized protein n=1 Tax=Eumeta variegata TaxID=151549 RepID=A0A4C1W7B4_EUMVA|nr:hypothetical protein EVAR_24180_1 [Eumeta japonica]